MLKPQESFEFPDKYLLEFVLIYEPSRKQNNQYLLEFRLRQYHQSIILASHKNTEYHTFSQYSSDIYESIPTIGNWFV